MKVFFESYSIQKTFYFIIGHFTHFKQLVSFYTLWKHKIGYLQADPAD